MDNKTEEKVELGGNANLDTEVDLTSQKGSNQLFQFLPKLIRYGLFFCLGTTLAVGVTVWLVIAIPELQKRSGPPAPLSNQEIALQNEQRIKEAEKTASWQNYHCNLYHLYFEGDDIQLPLGELLGLALNADQPAIEKRCQGLLSTVRLLGGWPTSRPQQDNIVVCEGFRFILKGNVPLAITPTRKSLAQGVVFFGLGEEQSYSQAIHAGQPTSVGRFAPIIVQADEQCIVVGVPRLGRAAAVSGRVVRVKNS